MAFQEQRLPSGLVQEMSIASKLYIGVVLASGGALLAFGLGTWTSPDPLGYLVFVLLSLIASAIKVPLPGITGTYSLGFLFVLIGILRFSLPEALLAGCLSALVQSVWKVKQRPSLLQVLFNMANLVLSIGLCFLVVHGALAEQLRSFPPAILAVAAFLYFVTNTTLVSTVLSLLEGDPFRQVRAQWYLWSFPYYLVGAALVGLLVLPGESPALESWLILVPLLYLVHFYNGLSHELSLRGEQRVEHDTRPVFTLPAKLYLGIVMTAGMLLLFWSLYSWNIESAGRFVGYLMAGLVTSTWKVRLPRMTGTISVSFVVLLAALVELSLGEVLVIAALAALVQSVWKPKVRPMRVQVGFSVSSMTLSAALAYSLHAILPGTSVLSLLVPAALLLFATNTLLVSLALFLVEEVPCLQIWQRCCFWSLPYYLVGSSFAGLIAFANHSAGWPTSFLILPLMALVYLSFRLQLSRVQGALSNSALKTGKC